MNLSFSTRGWPELSWDDMIQTALEMGFTGIEVYNLPKFDPMVERGGPFHKHKVAATVRQLRDLKLTIPCFDTSIDLSQDETCVEVLKSLGFTAVTGRVATGDWFATKTPRAEWIRDTFSPLLVEMEGCAIAQVCLRNGVKFAAVKSVSDHLFSDDQAEEYFDFSQALENLGAVILPLAKALQEE